MSFYPIQIEQCPGFGFTGGPMFQTNINDKVAGGESRNIDWDICRHKYTVPYKNISGEAYLAIKKVFLMCRGRGHTFLHNDLADHIATDEPFATGDGVTQTFQLHKLSADDSGAEYDRVITKPDASVVIKSNGSVVSATVSTTSGVVAFSSAPASGAVLTWSGPFFVHVRFDMDYMPFAINDKNALKYFNNGTIDLIEVLNEDA